MKSYLSILTSFVIFTMILFGIGCEPEATVEAEKPITSVAKQVEQAQPTPEVEPADTIKDIEPIAVESEVKTVETIQPEPEAKSIEPESVEAIDADIAVIVNGIEITENDIVEQIKPQLERLNQQAANMPPGTMDQYKAQIRSQALGKMITESLLDKEAKANNIIVTDEEANARLEEIASQQGMTMEDFQALVEARGQNMDETKKRIQKRLMYQKLMESQFKDKINVTVEEAKQYYTENKARFENPEQVRASHILIEAKPSDTEDVKKEAKAKAEELLKQIKAEGADFAALAKEHSACTSAASGGDLRFFGRSVMAKPFEDVAFALKVGQISDVVETPFGYHIIKLTDQKEAGVTSFEEAKDGIIAQLENPKKGQIAREYVESLREQANIVYPPGKEPAQPRPMMSAPGRAPSRRPVSPKPPRPK